MSIAASQRVADRPFWGWWIFVGAVIGNFASFGFGGQITGVFLEPVCREMGWSRAEFVSADTVGFAVSGLAALVVGPWLDRYGARPLMLGGALLGGSAMIAVSFVQELWEFVLLRGVLTSGGLLLVSGMVVNVTLSKWFVVRRAWLLTLASVGASLGGIVPPIVATALVESVGWRDAFAWLGVALMVLMGPTALLMRRRPEDYGLLPDGRVESQGSSEAERRALAAIQADMARSHTRAEAIRTPSFWIVAAAFAVGLAGAATIFSHGIPFLMGSGFARSEAALLFGVQGAASLVSKFVWAPALQRHPPRLLVLASLALMSLGTLGVAVFAPISVVGVVAALLVWGSGVGGLTPLNQFVWAAYFGRRHLGAVASTAVPITIAGGCVGMFATAVYRDAFGSYEGALVVLALMLGAAGLAVARADLPRARQAVSA